MKKRINIAIDPQLHEDAHAYAAKNKTSLSGLLTQLLVEKMADETRIQAAIQQAIDKLPESRLVAASSRKIARTPLRYYHRKRQAVAAASRG